MSLQWVPSIDGGAALAVDHRAGEDASAIGAQGVPLVFLHAGVSDRRSWAPQLDVFAQAHPVLAYDRRGFGATQVHRAVEHACVDDLWTVMDAAGFDRAVLVGCSQGGRIAIEAALAKPGRVLGLALVSPAITGAPTPEAYPPPVQALVDAYETADAAGDVERLNELEARVWLDGVLGEPLRVKGALRELFLDMNRMALDAAGPGPQRPAPPAWPCVHELGVPALVAWGPLDFPHLNEHCRHLVATLPQAQALVIDGTAHLPSMEKPEVFNIALAEFIATLGSASNAGGK